MDGDINVKEAVWVASLRCVGKLRKIYNRWGLELLLQLALGRLAQ